MLEYPDEQEKQARKKAIFDGMGKRGQKQVLKLGYENWDPFQEPKDPREVLRSASALRAGLLIQEFYQDHHDDERVRAHHKDLLDLCRGLLKGDVKANSLLEFCLWFDRNRPRD
ncbi:MAG: hypothetical protein AUK55_00790 [Syntrophobacteraceae bacterium CG2_30_61_12]|nr:MAG: hypothetical protein AUK55_00790 [Syntrophobacteraceae bacterium CG2_30_61_12]PIU31847.1 MAG: hypothetical protein COT06_05940 [Syntrophobacteraceae bacterium CG07_land_8_20_14_0_80_61_8]